MCRIKSPHGNILDASTMAKLNGFGIQMDATRNALAKALKPATEGLKVQLPKPPVISFPGVGEYRPAAE